jgi:hypothetical protein
MTYKELLNLYKSMPIWLGNQRQRDLTFTSIYNLWLKNMNDFWLKNMNNLYPMKKQ